MKLNIRKLKGFAFRHKISASVVLLALFLSVGAIVYESFFNKPLFNVPGLKLKEKPAEKYYAPFTGLETTSETLNKRPIAVVIENSPEARPQSGYRDADVVYETLAEGGITRTMAIFHSKESKEIGPIRSARPYFIDWLSEFNALFVHVGGSIDALDAIRNFKVADINQFNFGSYFWRSSDRYAPHNVYSTTGKLYDAAKKAGYETTASNLKWYKFKKEAEVAKRPPSQKVTINFSGPLFTVSYDYDSKTNDYARSVSGVAAKDKSTGDQVRAKNIIVQFETVSYGTTRAGEQKVNIGTIGSGNGLLFQDGVAMKIKWQKSDRNSLTKITDENDNEINLNPGQTWIEVPQVGATVSY